MSFYLLGLKGDFSSLLISPTAAGNRSGPPGYFMNVTLQRGGREPEPEPEPEPESLLSADFTQSLFSIVKSQIKQNCWTSESDNMLMMMVMMKMQQCAWCVQVTAGQTVKVKAVPV